MIAAHEHAVNRIRDNRGFTMIEALLAFAIFAIGFLAVGSMQINALTRTNSARRVSEAAVLADSQVEKLASLPFYADHNGFDDDHDGTVDNYDLLPDLTAGDHMDNDAWTGPFTIHWTVVDDTPLAAYPAGIYTVGAPLTRCKSIRVWVTPDNRPGDTLAEQECIKVFSADI